MADGIEAGAFLEYELGIQVMPDDGTDSFEGIDLLDPTKLVPEELAPVQLIGKLTLNRNPTNYFAETEQVAFHTGNLVPGIEVTNDPLMQARLFSYLDTQLTRLGGPNFTQLPINRPHCPVNDMLRDGMHQTAIHTGLAPYRPNSIDGGEPLARRRRATAATCRSPRPIEGTAVRASPASFDDHFSQADDVLPQPDAARAGPHRRGLHLRARQVSTSRPSRNASSRCWPTSTPTCAPRSPPASGCPPRTAARPTTSSLSPALSQIVTEPGPIAGRKIGIIADAGSDLAGIDKLRKAAAKLGAIRPRDRPVGGVLGSGAHAADRRPDAADRPLRSSSTRSSSPAARPRPATSS